MWEELIFVVEGSGYDLHWDLKWDCLEAFKWEWAPEPKAYSWKRGDFGTDSRIGKCAADRGRHVLLWHTSP